MSKLTDYAGRPFGVASASPWTPSELQPLGREYLLAILARDLKTVPVEETLASLRRQILTEQVERKYRGMVRWVEHGPDEILLYDPENARFGRQVVRLLEAIDSWSHVRSLARRGSPESMLILQVLWDMWDPSCPEECGMWDEGALDQYYEEEPQIPGIEDLLEFFPADMPFELPNQNGDGDYRFINPFDSRQMGVPLLLCDRYYVEHSTMMSTWESVPGGYLPFVEQSAKAIGWALAVGTRSDLMLE